MKTKRIGGVTPLKRTGEHRRIMIIASKKLQSVRGGRMKGKKVLLKRQTKTASNNFLLKGGAARKRKGGPKGMRCSEDRGIEGSELTRQQKKGGGKQTETLAVVYSTPGES